MEPPGDQNRIPTIRISFDFKLNLKGWLFENSGQRHPEDPQTGRRQRILAEVDEFLAPGRPRKARKARILVEVDEFSD